MKKLLAISSLMLGFASTLAFANVEMDINAYINPSHSYNIEESGDLFVIEQNFARDRDFSAGLEMQWGFFIGRPAKVLDIGINLSYGTDFFRSLNIGGVNTDGVFGVNAYIDFGPVVRLSPFDWLSLYVSPSFKVNSMVHVSESSKKENEDNEAVYSGGGIIIVTPEINLDLGARFWLVRAKNFHFGLDVGVDLSWDISGDAFNWEIVDSAWQDVWDAQNYGNVKKGFGANIYLGVCFNFGKTSYTYFKGLEKTE